MYGRAAVLLVMTVFAVSSRADWNSVAEGEIPVTRFTGLTSVIYSNSAHVNLSWVVQPVNATLFWIKCFVGNSTAAENQIYGYAFTEPPKSNASKEYRGRLTHKVYHIHNATVFQLTLSDPMYSDTGVYECVLHGSGSDDLVKARLTITYENRTKPSTSNHTAGGPDKVTGFTGLGSVMYNNSAYVNLTWVIEPENATVKWIMCFHGNSTAIGNKVYGYSFTDLKSRASSEYLGRLNHTVYYQDNATVFQLTITDPRYSDTGVYIGVLEDSGSDQLWEARLTLTYENRTKPSTSNHTAGGPDKEAGISITATVLGAIGGLLVASAAVFIARKTKNRRAEVKRKEQARRSKESIPLKTADEERKEDDTV